mgnify:CR=1 FL=1|tara:strand:+ start:5375 stop:5575 length:201 start_codon:yes stop_codon:yes gene_type:complete
MKHKIEKTERDYTDPVCGMKVNYKTAPEVLEYKNKIYCFCAPVCREAFEQDPERYLYAGNVRKGHE